MKVNNYLVTGADLATMGYTQKPGTTPILDGNIMNKGEASANYYIDPTVSPWSTYPNTRAPKYQDYPCPCVTGIEVYNQMENAINQTISYQDCSGNTYYVYLPIGSSIGIIACAPSGESGPVTGCGILRGSVEGINLSQITYIGCCYSNYPCTTSTTTTLPQCNYNGLTVVCNTPSTATLSWSFTIGGGALGTMELYVNGSIVESRNSASSGTRTVYVGDTINVNIFTSACGTGIDKANAYTLDIITDASCADGSVNLFTSVYTVTSGDVGNILSLRTFAVCDTSCV